MCVRTHGVPVPGDDGCAFASFVSFCSGLFRWMWAAEGDLWDVCMVLLWSIASTRRWWWCANISTFSCGSEQWNGICQFCLYLVLDWHYCMPGFEEKWNGSHVYLKAPATWPLDRHRPRCYRSFWRHFKFYRSQSIIDLKPKVRHHIIKSKTLSLQSYQCYSSSPFPSTNLKSILPGLHRMWAWEHLPFTSINFIPQSNRSKHNHHPPFVFQCQFTSCIAYGASLFDHPILIMLWWNGRMDIGGYTGLYSSYTHRRNQHLIFYYISHCDVYLLCDVTY